MIDFKISPGTAGQTDIPQRYDDLPSHDISVFQSENIQNILDARFDDSKPVEIHYEISKLDTAAIKNLKELLGQKYFDILKKSFVKSEADDIEEQIKKVKQALENEQNWHSLIITEKNTTGLLGSETGEGGGSNYHALMRHNNKSEKSQIGGGTFGKGSSVYTYSSGLWIWFAYSALSEKWEDTDKRFIGRGMIAPFIEYDQRQSYEGPLWYSRSESDPERKHQGLPYINVQADKKASDFGLTIRDAKDYGTTYLIPVFWPEGVSPAHMNAETLSVKLKQEIVKRWFVPIYRNDLICTISILGEDSDLTINADYLQTVPELRYKLEILDWYFSRAVEKDKKFKRKKINVKLPVLKDSYQKKIFKKYGKKLGNKQKTVQVDLVLRELDKDELPFEGFLDDDKLGTVNRIALTRNKGMIINHFPYNDRNKLDFIQSSGDRRFEAFLFTGRMSIIDLSDNDQDHLELFLGYAENPAHDIWVNQQKDLNRSHLKRFSETPIPFPVNRVNNLFKDLYTSIAAFFPKEDKPPFKKGICNFWKKLYRLPAAGQNVGGEIGFHYETLEKGYDQEGRYYWKIKFKASGPSETVKLVFNLHLNSLEGSIKKAEEYHELGIPEFASLEIIDNGLNVEKVVLTYDKVSEEAEHKDIMIRTCSLTRKTIYKNLEPELVVKSILN